MKAPSLHSMTGQAHRILSGYIRPGDKVVDATCGNGADTLWLAEQVGPTGEVWAVDLQPQAIEKSKALILQKGINTTLHWHTRSHEQWAELLPEETRGQIAAFAYNLGYRPGGNKALTTTASSSVPSIQTAIDWLTPGGVISVCSYRGHPQGDEEYHAVFKAVSHIPQAQGSVAEYRLINHGEEAPVLMLIQKAE